MRKTIAIVVTLVLVWIGYTAWPHYDLLVLVRGARAAGASGYNGWQPSEVAGDGGDWCDQCATQSRRATAETEGTGRRSRAALKIVEEERKKLPARTSSEVPLAEVQQAEHVELERIPITFGHSPRAERSSCILVR